MDSLLSKVRETIERHHLLDAGDCVLVAVSGGADSCALLLALLEFRDELHLTLHVAHLNHGLRVNADGDAEFVQSLAARFELPCTAGARDVAALRPPPPPALPHRGGGRRLSLEHAARIARYEFLEATADEVGAQKIAVGHTADDQVETVLLHLIRGSGARGLAGMPVRRRRIVRPLLSASHQECIELCRLHDVDYRTDETNADTRFVRNAVRHRVLPLLRELNPAVDEAVLRAASILSEEDEFLESLTAKAVATFGHEWPGRLSLLREAILSRPPAMQRRLLRAAMARMRPDLAEIELRHIDEVLRAVVSREHAGWTLPGGLRIRLDGEHLHLQKEPAVPEGFSFTPRTLSIPGVVDLPELGTRLEAALLNPCEMPCVRLNDTRVGYLDAGDRRSLTVRMPQPGDRFQPLGMSGTKKLHDFFVDCKVPRAERARIPVVIAGTDIAWVAGWRIDERFKVTDNTKSVLTLRLLEMAEKA